MLPVKFNESTYLIDEAQRVEEFSKQEFNKLGLTGAVMCVTDEERRLLKQFREFKQTCKPGGIFRWQTVPIGSR